MAKLWVTGPVLIYTGTTSSYGPEFLGTGETAPDIEIRGEFEGVINDLGGNRLPFDRIWEGEEGMISVVLTRWNEDVLARVMSRPDAFTGIRGRDTGNDIGTLIGSEGFTYPVWCAFPYSPLNVGGKAAMAGMPAGYRFWSCMNVGPDRLTTGTRANKHHLMFHAMRSWGTQANPMTQESIQGSFRPGSAGSTFKLYDHDMSALAAGLFN